MATFSKRLVSPTIRTSDGFAFRTWSQEEGIRAHTFATRCLAATDRGALLRGFRLGNVPYQSFDSAPAFGRALREAIGTSSTKRAS